MRRCDLYNNRPLKYDLCIIYKSKIAIDYLSVNCDFAVLPWKDSNPHTEAQQLCEFKTVNNRKYIVDKIKKYMEEHYREKISLDQIATNMYLSPFYISKLFKSETGDTPINYLINLRMTKAKRENERTEGTGEAQEMGQ